MARSKGKVYLDLVSVNMSNGDTVGSYGKEKLVGEVSATSSLAKRSFIGSVNIYMAHASA